MPSPESFFHKMPFLSAVICTYQRYHVLGAAIASLRAQTLAEGALEIIIVDNSADQQAAHKFAQAYRGVPGLQYLCEPATGLSNARNIALAVAQAPIIGFIDDDAIAAPGWAQAILDGFAQLGEKAGAVGGPVSPRWLSPRPAWLGDDLLGCLAIIDLGNRIEELPPELNIFGCNMALNRDLALKSGGFSKQLGRIGSELTLLSNEENGLFMRIRAAGRAIGYTPHAQVEHVIDPSRLTRNWFRRRAAWQAVSDFLMDPDHFAKSALAKPPLHGVNRTPDAEDAACPLAFSVEFWASYHATLTALAGGALPVTLADAGAANRAARVRGQLFALTQKQRHIARLGWLGLRGYRRLTGR
jgi:GT2 family glycosyltransferase